MITMSIPHNSDLYALRRSASFSCRFFQIPPLEVKTFSNEILPELNSESDSDSLPDLIDRLSESEESIEHDPEP